jgi:hypothetical protein
MKVSNNDKLIERNIKLGRTVLFLALLTLAIGLIIAIIYSKIGITYLLLIPAYLIVQLSIFMINHWSRSPRPDEAITSSLKGVNNQYYLYNYNTGVPHLLICPAGIWIIKPYYQDGQISYDKDKKRYIQTGGPGFIGKVFSQEGLPNIERSSIKLLEKYNGYMEEHHISTSVAPQFVDFFYSEEAVINSENESPELMIQADKFKDFIRLEARKVVLSDDEIQRITDQLPKAVE